MATMKQPTFEQVQRELTGCALGLAVLADECIENGAGKRMLGLAPTDRFADLVDSFDPARIRAARHLWAYYEYAYNARVPGGHERTIDPNDNLAELLRDFTNIVHSDSGYFDLCMDVVGLDANTETGFLADMIDRWTARFNLDDGGTLTLAQLATLADMNERSVRNATSLEGEAGLKVNQDQTVDNNEARRWLSGRRGFEPTVFQKFADDPAALNQQLSKAEIPAFVAQRLATHFSETALDEWLLQKSTDGTFDSAIPPAVTEAAESAGIAPNILAKAMRSPLRIEPGECEAIAKAIRVDPVWFTLQVMQALYPKPMDMILNPSAYRHGKEHSGEVSPIEFVFELTKAMIEHGYLDFPSSVKSMFPADCLGTRAEGDQGAKVEIRYGGSAVQTDIRRKSELTLSPRSRFGAWLKTSLQARPGDRMKVAKVSERVFELTHLPSSSL